MPDTVMEASSGLFLALVEFSWGDPDDLEYRRFAIGTQSVTANGNVFSPVPTMKVNLGKQEGGTQDAPATIEMPFDLEPVTFMIGQTFYTVTVKIWEVDPQNVADTLRVRWAGEIDRVDSNYSQNADMIRVNIPGWKAKLADASIGLPVINECIRVFGEGNCHKNLAPLRETGTITAIDGKRVTLTGLSSHPLLYWKRGTIKFKGMELTIKAWNGSTLFIMMRRPPADWAGQSVVVTPGCLKTIGAVGGGDVATCRYWGREEDFAGFGQKMPETNPLFETGNRNS